MTTRTFKCNRCGTDCVFISEGERNVPKACPYSMMIAVQADFKEMK